MDILSGEKFCWTVTECISWSLTGKFFLRLLLNWRGDSKKVTNKYIFASDSEGCNVWGKTEELPLSVQNLLK